MASLVSLAAQEFCTCCHVAPLVRTTDLQGYTVILIEDIEVISLHDLVGEFCIGNPCLNPALDRIFTHHVVDSEVFADIAQEVDKADAAEPVIIVDHFGLIITLFKVQKARKLILDRFHPAFHGFLGLETALSILKRWIANQSSCSSNQSVGFVSG